MLLTPIKKDNKYVSHPSHTINMVITDVKIKSIRKLNYNKGYSLVLYISQETNYDIIKELEEMDDNIVKIIENKSHTWFGKTLTNENIYELYAKNFCNQTKTINVILTNKKYDKIMYNNKSIETVDNIIDILKEKNHYKKCIINITIEYYGIYFYSETTSNKWVVKNMDVTDINLDTVDWVNKDDIIDKLEDNIINIKNKLINRCENIDIYKEELYEQEKKIDKLYSELNTCNKNKLEPLLNKLNENIILQEDKINRNF